MWNQAVSERLRRFGRQVLIGDLVVERENADLIENVAVDEIADVVEEEPEDEEAKGERRVVNPVIDVTEENIGKYTIEDVVMPMVGHNVNLPKNVELAKIITDLLLKDGITMTNFAQMASQDSLSASGAYRKIVTKANDIVFDIVDMQNENEDLIAADYLKESDPTPVITVGENQTAVTKALRMRFNLKTSSYATMLIREVTRTSSAFSAQYKLSLEKK